jgi:hypothetical protein
MPIKRN